jgi:hypothetical protein
MFGLLFASPAMAGLGTMHVHDETKNCRSLVTLKNPPKSQWKAEFAKCMADPKNY